MSAKLIKDFLLYNLVFIENSCLLTNVLRYKINLANLKSPSKTQTQSNLKICGKVVFNDSLAVNSKILQILKQIKEAKKEGIFLKF